MGVRRGDLDATFLPEYYAGMAGTNSVGYFYFSGGVLDTETLVIGGYTYEFDTNGVYTAGNIPVDVSAGVTAALATAALVATLNAQAASPVSAANLTGDVCGLYVDDVGSNLIALSAAGTPNATASAAAMTNGSDDATQTILFDTYTVTAQDVTTWAAGDAIPIASGTFANGAPQFMGTPLLLNATDQIVIYTTANMVFTWTQISGYRYQLSVLDTAADLANTDTISWSAIG